MLLWLCLWEGERRTETRLTSQAALTGLPRVSLKTLASPVIVLGPQPLPSAQFFSPSFCAGSSGQAVTRPDTSAQCPAWLGHLGLELLVGANSRTWPSPVALMDFITRLRLLAGCLGEHSVALGSLLLPRKGTPL